MQKKPIRILKIAVVLSFLFVQLPDRKVSLPIWAILVASLFNWTDAIYQTLSFTFILLLICLWALPRKRVGVKKLDIFYLLFIAFLCLPLSASIPKLIELNLAISNITYAVFFSLALITTFFITRRIIRNKY